ncbi:hypothetical protein CPB83DRAFT_864529 [Crepidotus variabilis]|uniref:Uncharacterized protein n=1 Tax=Crepidotus variabilis TaxID=179855 RepID=A0A9P6E4H5_9AGAR|nr:hypothetical protein CPB83DRAFT_864529 [Crepidotus variabilis]
MAESMDYNLDMIKYLRMGSCFLFSGLTLIIWDLLENIPDDVRLFTIHPIQLPSIIYLLSRISTLCYFTYNQATGGRGNISYWTCLSLLAFQRVTNLTLLYLRVHALYRSNQIVQAIFSILGLGVIGSCFLHPMISGLCTGVFEIGIAVAIIVYLKLGWLQGVSQKVWKPFKFRPEAPITDKILQDSLGYLLLAIVLKVPQLMLLGSSPGINQVWEGDTLFLDAAIMCIVSTKIFRDLKLGHWTINSPPRTAVFQAPQALSETSTGG